MSDPNELLSPAQVASLLRIAKKTLQGWIYKHKGAKGPKWVKIGGDDRGRRGKVWYRREDVEEYLKNGGDR